MRGDSESDRFALRGGEHAGSQADEAASGDGELQVDLAFTVIHADELTHLFDRFWRSEGGRTRGTFLI